MTVGFIGAGAVARHLSMAFGRSGHDVVLGRRGGTPSFIDAVTAADIVVIAIPYTACAQVLPTLAALLRGKVVIDATNPLAPDYSPLIIEGGSAGETVAGLLPGARLVKAFNTVFADAMLTAADAQPALAAFVAGDDAEAVERVAALARSAGYAPLMVRSLKAARYLEAMAHLNIALAFGSGIGTGGGFLYRRGDESGHLTPHD